MMMVLIINRVAMVVGMISIAFQVWGESPLLNLTMIFMVIALLCNLFITRRTML